MNLKEAFRFQNKLQALLLETQSILDKPANVTLVENTYLRHKVNPEAADETVADLPDTEYADRITSLVSFLGYLLVEKERLFAAIRTAKNALPLDMDSEVSLNATRQSIARTLAALKDLRASEQLLSNLGTGYRFNAEGNQITYRCDVRRVTTINYDRNLVRRELTKLNRAADAASAALDLALVTAVVDYTPPFDVNDSFNDAFEHFLEVTGA